MKSWFRLMTDELQWLVGPGQGGVQQALPGWSSQPVALVQQGTAAHVCPWTTLVLKCSVMYFRWAVRQAQTNLPNPAPMVLLVLLILGPQLPPRRRKTWWLLSLDEVLWQPHWNPSTTQLRGTWVLPITLGNWKAGVIESWSKSRKQPKLAEPHRTTERVEFKHWDKVWARFLSKAVLFFFSFMQLISKERPRQGKKTFSPPQTCLFLEEHL